MGTAIYSCMQLGRHRIYNIEDLCGLDDGQDLWLVENMIPRIGRTIVYGQGNTFKTTLIFDLAIAVASEGLLLRDIPIKRHGPVLVISTESSIYNNRNRILGHLRPRALHSNEKVQRGKGILPSKDEVKLHYCQQAYDFDDKDDQDSFREVMEAIKPVMVVFDPLDSFFSGDENSAKETKKLRRYMDGIITDYQTSLIFLHHATKNEEKPSIRGSSAWRGWVDTALYCQKASFPLDGHNVEGFKISSDKQRDGQTGHIMSVGVTHDPVQKFITFDIIIESGDKEMQGLSLHQSRIFNHLLSSQAATQQELIAAVGVGHRKIKHLLDSMQSDGLISYDATVTRPCGPNGASTRNVPAWRLTGKASQINDAVSVIRAREANVREDANYDVEFVDVDPAKWSSEHGSVLQELGESCGDDA